MASGVNSTDSSAGKLRFSPARFIDIGWKRSFCVLRDQSRKRGGNILWTGDRQRPLVFVRLLSQGHASRPTLAEDGGNDYDATVARIGLGLEGGRWLSLIDES